MRSVNDELHIDELIEHGIPIIDHSAWLIVRCRPRAETIAADSLRADGFEVFLPMGRRVVPMPLRFVPPKKRKLRRRMLREDVFIPYPGYLFVRRIFSPTPCARLYEINGVSGVCCFGERLATLSDYRIGLLRLAMETGDFDRWETTLSAKDYHLAEIVPTLAAKKMWNGSRKLSSYVDDSGRSVHLIEEFGRITRVLSPPSDENMAIYTAFSKNIGVTPSAKPALTR